MKLPVISLVSAILPIYTLQGDSTKLILNSGDSIIINKPLHSVITIYADQRSIDLRTLRKNIQKSVYKKNMLPLPLANNAVFFQAKTRTPRIKRDACNSYINVYQFVNARQSTNPEYSSEVLLKHNIRINCLWSAGCIKQHALQAKLVRSNSLLFLNYEQDLATLEAAALIVSLTKYLFQV